VSGIEVEIPTFQNRPLASEQLNPRASDAQYRPTDIAVAPSCPSPGEVRTHERLSREAPRLTLNSLGQCVIRLLSAPDACELPNRHSNEQAEPPQTRSLSQPTSRNEPEAGVTERRLWAHYRWTSARCRRAAAERSICHSRDGWSLPLPRRGRSDLRDARRHQAR
jgi:hypothetical protein